MTMGLYCWSEDGGDSLISGFHMTGQRFSLYGEGPSRELEDLDVCVCGLKGLMAVQLSRACGIQTRSGAWLGS